MEVLHDIDLLQMRNADIRTADRDTLADITEIHIDGKLPRKDRPEHYLKTL